MQKKVYELYTAFTVYFDVIYISIQEGIWHLAVMYPVNKKSKRLLRRCRGIWVLLTTWLMQLGSTGWLLLTRLQVINATRRQLSVTCSGPLHLVRELLMSTSENSIKCLPIFCS